MLKTRWQEGSWALGEGVFFGLFYALSLKTVFGENKPMRGRVDLDLVERELVSLPWPYTDARKRDESYLRDLFRTKKGAECIGLAEKVSGAVRIGLGSLAKLRTLWGQRAYRTIVAAHVDVDETPADWHMVAGLSGEYESMRVLLVGNACLRSKKLYRTRHPAMDRYWATREAFSPRARISFDYWCSQAIDQYIRKYLDVRLEKIEDMRDAVLDVANDSEFVRQSKRYVNAPLRSRERLVQDSASMLKRANDVVGAVVPMIGSFVAMESRVQATLDHIDTRMDAKITDMGREVREYIEGRVRDSAEGIIRELRGAEIRRNERDGLMATSISTIEGRVEGVRSLLHRHTVEEREEREGLMKYIDAQFDAVYSIVDRTAQAVGRLGTSPRSEDLYRLERSVHGLLENVAQVRGSLGQLNHIRDEVSSIRSDVRLLGMAGPLMDEATQVRQRSASIESQMTMMVAIRELSTRMERAVSRISMGGVDESLATRLVAQDEKLNRILGLFSDLVEDDEQTDFERLIEDNNV